MKLLSLFLVLAAIAAPVSAQNATQIARAQKGANCPKCNLFQADFTNLTLRNKNFAGARLRQADFGVGTFNGSNFTGADLRDINGSAALFGRANFAYADLTNANFVGAYLEHANFKGTKLDGVNFSGAEMASAVGLTQAQMDRTCGDPATLLPKGLRIPTCTVK